MDDRSQIKGDRIRLQMEELVKANTLVNMRLRGVEGYERLTMINEISKDGADTFLVIDPPRDFQSAIAKEPRWRLQFTFTGLDKIEYNFSTQGGRLKDDAIWVPMPTVVNRVQRRRHFRVETPPGTLLVMTVNGEARALDLINLSQGGSLGVVSRRRGERLSVEPLFKVGAQFFNLTVVCPGNEDTETTRAAIKKAVVRRVEEDRQQYKHRYALEFTEMAPPEQRTVTTFIYRLQREYLRKR